MEKYLIIKAKGYYGIMASLVDSKVIFEYDGKIIKVPVQDEYDLDNTKIYLEGLLGKRKDYEIINPLREKEYILFSLKKKKYILFSFNDDEGIMHYRLRSQEQIDEEEHKLTNYYVYNKLNVSQIQELLEDIKHIDSLTNL